MQRVTDFIRQHLLSTSVGISVPDTADVLPRLDCLRYSEWSDRFEKLMRNRLLMGVFRYGLLIQKHFKYDRPNDMIDRLMRYKDDGNVERLVDVANLCLLEFEEGDHPKRHFGAMDDSAHTRCKG